jgi:hypothetical protein
VDTECGVCCRTYTSKVRTPVTCPTCQNTTCTACVKTYLLSTFQDPHCMKDTCRRPWNDEFLDTHLTTAFRTGALKLHRQNVLVERQRALLPARQGLVERHRALLAVQAVQAGAKQESKTASELHLKEELLLRAMEAALRHLQSGPHQLTRTCGRLFDVPQACVFEGGRRTCINCSTGLCGECGFVWFSYNEAAGENHVCVRYPSTPEERSVVEKRMTREMAAQKAVNWLAGQRAAQARARLHQANFNVAQVRFPTGRAPAGAGAAADERAKFVRQCPVSACRGFLSTAWKCGTCDTWACPNCHEVKGATKDAAHTCNPDCVASARLLEKETRPCPKCASAIFKISGCFAPNTPILMWSGDVKLSQHVAVGDQLVGDDGLVRTVLRTIHGEDEMFEIGQSHGASYTVNQYHTLALKSAAAHDDDDGVVELTVRDFMAMPLSMKTSLQGFKFIAGVSKQEQEVARSGLTVEPKGSGIYHGWEVDGNHRFLLDDFTVVRNCNQMWCTACNNGFDWVTGKEIRTGAIHNPHFFEFMGRGGPAAAVAPAGGAAAANAPQQQPGMCGAVQERLPLTHIVHSRLSARSSWAHPVDESRNAFQRIMAKCMRLGHLTDTSLRTYTRRAHNINLEHEQELGVQYLMGIIDDQKWREQLQRGEKRRHKYVAILQVLEMFTQTGSLIINRGIAETGMTLVEIDAQLAALQKYSDEAMRAVSHSCKPEL